MIIGSILGLGCSSNFHTVQDSLGRWQDKKIMGIESTR